MYQYQIVFNGAKSEITEAYPGESWANIAEIWEQRGGKASFNRRLVTDSDMMPGISDPAGWIVIGDRAISPWECLAELDDTPAELPRP